MTRNKRIGWEQRARSTEVQDIAAIDRLAAGAAPASALRRYAASRVVAGEDRRRRPWSSALRATQTHVPR